MSIHDGVTKALKTDSFHVGENIEIQIGFTSPADVPDTVFGFYPRVCNVYGDTNNLQEFSLIDQCPSTFAESHLNFAYPASSTWVCILSSRIESDLV